MRIIEKGRHGPRKAPIRVINIKRIVSKIQKQRYMVRNYALEQTMQTTIHGVSMVFDDKKHLIERTFWLCSIIGALVSIAYLSTPLYERYKTSPTVMSVEMDYFNWNISFPAITLCPDYAVDQKRLDILLETYKQEERDNVSAFISTLASVGLYTAGAYTLENSDLINPEDYARIISMVFPDVDKVQVTANTNEPIGRDTVMTEMGMCAVINSNVSQYDEPSNWDTTSHSQNKNSIEVNVHDGMFFIQVANFTDTYRIFIHSPNEVVESTSLSYKQKGLTFISLNIFIESTRSSKDVKDLSIRQRNCRYIDEPISPRYTIYSYNRCIKECRINMIKALCGCVPHFYKRTGGLFTTSAEERPCALSELSCVSKYRIELQHLSVPPEVRQGRDATFLPATVRDCACLQSCEEHVYMEDSVDITWASLSVMRVGLEVYPKIRYTRGILFGFYDVLVRIGGVMNLCLGISVISVAELIIFFILKPLVTCLRLGI